jgi:GNAT superfamily N-acetyltransferase
MRDLGFGTWDLTITIRSASASDVPLILQLIRELAEYERLAHQVVASESAIHDTLFGEHARAEVLIAEAERRPAGFALFFHNYSTFLAKSGVYLEDVYVRPEFRRRGIGRALLTRLARIAVERGCGRFEWAVLDWNVSAQRFYESLGARPMSDWTTYRLTGEPLAALAAQAVGSGHADR